MIITCGPDNDIREVTIQLPDESSKIAVFVSGGLDSAIMYFLLLQANKQTDWKHKIFPFVARRNEGSRYFANLVVAQVRDFYNLKYREPQVVGDSSLPDHLQVKSGVWSALEKNMQQVYIGAINQLPQHAVDWDPIPLYDDPQIQYPFKSLNKNHVVDLIVKLKQEHLFYITHSCSINEIGRCRKCNGCNERSWAFDQLGIVDPGML